MLPASAGGYLVLRRRRARFGGEPALATLPDMDLPGGYRLRSPAPMSSGLWPTCSSPTSSPTVGGGPGRGLPPRGVEPLGLRSGGRRLGRGRRRGQIVGYAQARLDAPTLVESWGVVHPACRGLGCRLLAVRRVEERATRAAGRTSGRPVPPFDQRGRWRGGGDAPRPAVCGRSGTSGTCRSTSRDRSSGRRAGRDRDHRDRRPRRPPRRPCDPGRRVRRRLGSPSGAVRSVGRGGGDGSTVRPHAVAPGEGGRGTGRRAHREPVGRSRLGGLPRGPGISPRTRRRRGAPPALVLRARASRGASGCW